jgi:tRNA dimethylallyltransferase
VDKMISAGLEDEARALYSSKELNALQTVGYQELFDYFDGITSLENAIARIRQHSRNYAKRQLTWFPKDQDIIWFDGDKTDMIIPFLEKKIQELQTNP